MTAQPASQAPGDQETRNADDGADQAPRLVDIERQDFCRKRREDIEAAAIHVQIGKGERAGVVEPRTVHAQQKIGILGMGVIVPAEAVIAKGQRRDRRYDDQHADGQSVEPLPCARAS